MADQSTAADPLRSGLTRLKREGCAVLVAGRVPERLLDDLSARLLGDATGDRDRVRVVGLVDRPLDRARTRLSLALGEGDAGVVATAGGRTAAAAGGNLDTESPGGEGPGVEPLDGGRPDADRPDADRPDDGPAPGASVGPVPGASVERVAGVEQFADALPAAVERAAAEPASLDPAALRVCVDSLRPLVTAPGVDHRAFVERVRTECTRRRAIAHFVLPAPADGETAAALSPLFDVVVSLRTRDGPEQRWHLRAADHRTDWVRVPEWL